MNILKIVREFTHERIETEEGQAKGVAGLEEGMKMRTRCIPVILPN